MIDKAIKQLVDNIDLDENTAVESMRQIMTGKVTAAQISAFLVALRMKGETIDEIYSCAKVMREMSFKVQAPDGAVDTCGTGSDGTNTFNISTVAAFVVAGAGHRS